MPPVEQEKYKQSKSAAKRPREKQVLGKGTNGSMHWVEEGKVGRALIAPGSPKSTCCSSQGGDRGVDGGRAGSLSPQLSIPGQPQPNPVHGAAKVPEPPLTLLWLELYGGGQGRSKALPLPTQHHKTRSQGFPRSRCLHGSTGELTAGFCSSTRSKVRISAQGWTSPLSVT